MTRREPRALAIGRTARKTGRADPTVTTALVLDAEAITHFDSAGLQALEDLAGSLKDDDIALHFAQAKSLLADRITERMSDASFTARSARRCTPRCAIYPSRPDLSESQDRVTLPQRCETGHEERCQVQHEQQDPETAAASVERRTAPRIVPNG